MTIELLNMDCMDFMRDQPDNAFDLAIVDPPYGRGEHGGKNRSHMVKQSNGNFLLCGDGGYAKKDWDNEVPGPDYFSELFRVSKNQIIWGANYFPGLPAAGAVVWDKVNDGADQSACEIAFNSLTRRVDMIRYMWRGMMQGQSLQNGTRQQGNKSLNEKRIHPTQKPILLYSWLLEKFAEPGSKILDTHSGSGSLAISCWDLGFDLWACEKDADYHSDSVERLKDAQRQMSLFGGAA